MSTPDLELYQAEWCPFSHRVRMRLTELGLDVVLRQVPVARSDRDEMAARVGTRAIPTLIVEGEPVVGSDAILAILADRGVEPAGARRHRAQLAADWPLWLAQHAAVAS